MASQLRMWAREGAVRRLAELKKELAAISKLFPDLTGGARPQREAPRRKRRRMSAASRAKISAAQKKRWAAKRKAEAK